MATQKTDHTTLVYKTDDPPRSVRDWVIYSLQWVVTMVYAVVWGYALVGIRMEFTGRELTAYMSAVVLTIGLSTLVQAWLGHRMAMVSGPNVIPSLAIVAAITFGGKEYAQQAFLAQAIAGGVIILLTVTGIVKIIKKIWSPLVLGCMVLLVGLSISKQGLALLAEAGFGWPFFTGIALALLGLLIALRVKGVWGTLPPLIIILLGYVIFMVTGEFDWSLVRTSGFFTLPRFFPYGVAMPPADLIIIMIVVNLMAGLNMFGNVTGFAGIVGQQLKDSALKRAFLFLGGIETGIAGLLGAPATVAYGENLGIVMLTRVAARSFLIAAAILFLFFAFIGPVSGFMAAMPKPVAGAVLLGIASTVIGIGVRMIVSSKDFGRQQQGFTGFSVFLSLGLFLLPAGVWKDAPRVITTIFSNPVISVILFVLLFEQVIFRRKQAPE